jgi:CRISPR-associated protein Csm1
MSVQLFLQGKILGVQDFLTAPSRGLEESAGAARDKLVAGRSRWVTLLGEVLPRALLAELGLSKLLLGSSGGGQFMVVLPSEAGESADRFLEAAHRQIQDLSAGLLHLVWASTENLGDWMVVRKRLSEAMQRKQGAPAAGLAPEAFQPYTQLPADEQTGYFTQELADGLQSASAVGWSPETPGMVLVGAGKYTWPLASVASPDAIAVARHVAMTTDGHAAASLPELARGAQGRPAWGVLRGDVDSLGIRFRRVQTIEEHLQLSVMYKQFFAGELQLVCSLPDYWRKVSILYTGGDDFAVYGCWDALIPLAREIQRLFHRFTEENLKDFPGPEGKTITMAMAIASDAEVELASVYEEAGRLLEIAKSTDKDCIFVLGHTLEWRQLAAASDLRETMRRMAAEIDSPRRFLAGLAVFYRKAATGRKAGVAGRYFEKPWQVQRHLNRALGETRDKELQKLRTHLTNEILAKGASQMRVRPGGRVALEWARLLTEVQTDA